LTVLCSSTVITVIASAQPEFRDDDFVAAPKPEQGSIASDGVRETASWQPRSRFQQHSIPLVTNSSASELVLNINSSTNAALRGHTRNKLLHQMFVCASPGQTEVFKLVAKCKSLWPNETWPVRDSWGGGNQLKCIGSVEQPECIRLGTICTNNEVPILDKPCHFPFEYKGKIYTQCHKEAGLEKAFCFDAPNFQTPCSFAATMAGCVDDAPTREAYQENKMKLPCTCEQKGYWNAPPSGGTILTIIGSGFGSWEKPCDDAYMTCLKEIVAGNDNDKLATIDQTCIAEIYGSDSEYLPADQNQVGRVQGREVQSADTYTHCMSFRM